MKIIRRIQVFCSPWYTPDCLFTMHLCEMPNFSTLLSIGLYTFVLVAVRLNYDLHVVFYVGFHNFRKNQHLKSISYKL